MVGGVIHNLWQIHCSLICANADMLIPDNDFLQQFGVKVCCGKMSLFVALLLIPLERMCDWYQIYSFKSFILSAGHLHPCKPKGASLSLFKSDKLHAEGPSADRQFSTKLGLKEQ